MDAAKEPRKRRTRSPEFLAFVRKVRGLRDKSPDGKRIYTPGEMEKINRERRKEYYKKKRQNGIVVPADRTEPEKPHRVEHNLLRDRKTGNFKLKVLLPNGTKHYFDTGKSDVSEALKAIDETGVQRLSILARKRDAIRDINQVTADAHAVESLVVWERWKQDLLLDQSPSTAMCYTNAVRHLFRRFACEAKPVAFLTREMLHGFVNEESVKYTTREQRLASIRSFYRHAAAYGHVIGNLSDTIKINQRTVTIEQRTKIPAVPFSEEEYRKVVDCQETPAFWRQAAAISYWLGLRMVDVCTLEVASLGDDFGVLYPKKTGGRKLMLPLHDPLIGSGELRRVFDEIRAGLRPNQIHCFPGQRKTYLAHPSVLSADFREACERAGVHGRTFHSLRHAFKLRMEAAGRSIKEIAELMGHADTRVTEGYGRAVTTEPSGPLLLSTEAAASESPGSRPAISG